MKHYGYQNPEGSTITNLTVPRGAAFPSNPDEGELFYRDDQNQLYVYDGTSWTTTGSSSVSNLDDLNDVDAPSPTDRQSLVWNATNNAWEADNSGPGPGRLLARTVYTSGSGTHTFNTDTSNYKIIMVGGGGAGGGVPTTGSGQSAEGAGGGAGAYLQWYGSKPSASASYAVGAGGAGVSGGNGNAGSDSTWDDGTNSFTVDRGNGGESGGASTGNIRRIGASGGTEPTGGDINAAGGNGHAGIVTNGIYFGQSFGGTSAFGAGGRGGNSSNGGDASAPGSGGGGATSGSNTGSTRRGGNGANGIIIVEEYSSGVAVTAENTTDLNDFATTVPSNNDILQYNSTASEWQPVTDNYAFRAVKDTAQNNISQNTWTTVTFGDEIFDEGNVYDGTDTFTAPVDGIYHFDAVILVDNVGTARFFQVRFFINSSDAVSVQRDRNDSGIARELLVGGGVTLKLNQNDTVIVQVFSSSPNDADLVGNSSNFSGHLVKAL